MAVTPEGQVQPAISSGSAQVQRFFIAPNGHVYVLFVSPVSLTNAGAATPGGCVLAEVDRDSGVPTCIDNSLSGIGQYGVGPATTRNPWVQFDGAGAIYYAGRTSTGTLVLRRYLAGATTDLINDNISLNDFVALQDGSVIVNGKTNSTGAEWVRRITPVGGLQTLAPSSAMFVKQFPDNNVYFGVWGPSDYGIKRFLTDSNQLDTKYWFTGNINGVTRDGYFNADTYCSGTDQTTRYSFCGWYGGYQTAWFRTTDGKMYGIAGSSNQPGLLTEYYPTIGFPQTEVTNVRVAQGVITNLILAGLNASNQNVLTVYNTSNDAETQLLGPDNEIEIYHVNYVAAGNKVMFDGLRFADNKYVLGEVDLNNNQVNVSATLSAKWADFQTFG